MYELLIKPLWAVVLSFFMVLVYHLTKWHFFFSLIPWCKVCLLCCLFHCKLLIPLPHFGRSRILFYTTYTESVELCSWGIVNQYRLFFINCYGLVRVFNWVFFFPILELGSPRIWNMFIYSRLSLIIIIWIIYNYWYSVVMFILINW